jgi:hypothetical protein
MLGHDGEAERTKLARTTGAQRRLHGLWTQCLIGEAEREGFSTASVAVPLAQSPQGMNLTLSDKIIERI